MDPSELLLLVKDAGLVGALIFMVHQGITGRVVPTSVIERIVSSVVEEVLEELRKSGHI